MTGVEILSAKSICQFRGGVLYEPKNLTEFQIVRKVYNDIWQLETVQNMFDSNSIWKGRNCFWLGIDDVTTEGTYLYRCGIKGIHPYYISSIEIGLL